MGKQLALAEGLAVALENRANTCRAMRRCGATSCRMCSTWMAVAT
jgi:hypothetical protein